MNIRKWEHEYWEKQGEGEWEVGQEPNKNNPIFFFLQLYNQVDKELLSQAIFGEIFTKKILIIS